MSKPSVWLSLFLAAALLLAACTPGEEPGTPETDGLTTPGAEGTGGDGEIPETGATGTPGGLATMPAGGAEATQTTGGEATEEEARETPSAGEGTAIVTLPPGTGLMNDYRLISTLLTFDLEDAQGNPIGEVDDIVINVCEARIDYLTIGPDVSLEITPGSVMLVPFLAVNTGGTDGGAVAETQAVETPEATETEGTAEATEAAETESAGVGAETPAGAPPGVENRTLVLQDDITMDVIAGAPVNVGAPNISRDGWDAEASTYWSEVLGVPVTTECLVDPAGGTGAAGTPSATEEETGSLTEVPPTDAATGEAAETPSSALTPSITETPSTEQTAPAGTPTVEPTGVVSPTEVMSPTVEATPGAGGEQVGVNRIILASELRSTDLVDGSGNTLGRVGDAIMNDSLTRLDYLVVIADPSLEMGANNILVIPSGAFNVEYPTNDFRQPQIVLLVEGAVLEGAPAFSHGSIDLTSADWDADVMGYWQQHVDQSDDENQ